MDVKLVVEKGPTRVRIIHIRNEETVIGRQKGCDLRIPSGTVSRRHCVLRYQNDYLTVEDLDSANGTFLNGERISGKEVVRPGDRLEVGPLVFLAEYQLTQAAIDFMLMGADAGEDVAVEEALPVVDDEPGLVECLPEIEGDLPTVEGEMMPAQSKDKDREIAAGAGAESVVILDETQPWQLPDEGELRDILSNLEE
jgi:hypothetical protein